MSNTNGANPGLTKNKSTSPPEVGAVVVVVLVIQAPEADVKFSIFFSEGSVQTKK
jgi:hypothetical protein